MIILLQVHTAQPIALNVETMGFETWNSAGTVSEFGVIGRQYEAG